MPLWQIRSYRIPEIRDPHTTPYPELYQAYFRPRAFQSEFSQGRAGVQMDRPLFIESFVSSGRDCRSSCPFLIFGLLLWEFLYSNMSSMKFPVSQSLELKLFLRGSRFSILSRRRRGDWSRPYTVRQGICIQRPHAELEVNLTQGTGIQTSHYYLVVFTKWCLDGPFLLTLFASNLQRSWKLPSSSGLIKFCKVPVPVQGTLPSDYMGFH